METFPLHSKNGHIFVEIEGNLWLYDTGAPGSFGRYVGLWMAGERFEVSENYLGLTAETLSGFTGVSCVGLLGANVLGRFDHILDTEGCRLTVSTGQLSQAGNRVPLDNFMGIPIVTARVGDINFRMFFDTGAQISYFQDNSLADFPMTGTVTDFYPGFGQFQTETHEVPFSLGGVEFNLRCGKLPGILGTVLGTASTVGIVGNAVLVNRTIGYFPRRNILIIGT